MSWRALVLVASAALFAAAAVTAQATWQLEGGRGRARVVAERSFELAPGAGAACPAGAAAVHFAADAAGKPRSLAFEVGDGDRVVVAASSSPATQRAPVDATGSSSFTGRLGPTWGNAPVEVRACGRSDALRDVQLSVRVARSDQSASFALVGRHSEGGCYLLVLDWAAAEVRLERVMGFDRMVLARAAAPPVAAEVALTLQLEGFRIQGFVDDAPVVRSFDGAISAGGAGVAWSGTRPTWRELSRARPAAPRASAAVVGGRGRAAVHAAVAAAPGSLAVLELQLDRPHAWIPRSAGGFEPWLRQPAAAPLVARGDVRGSLGKGVLGEVDSAGNLHAELVWPDLPALRLQVALATWRVVTPSGGPTVARTPAVRVIF